MYRKLNRDNACSNYIEVGRVTGSEQLFVDGNVPNNSAYDYAMSVVLQSIGGSPTLRESGLSRSALSIPNRPSPLQHNNVGIPTTRGHI